MTRFASPASPEGASRTEPSWEAPGGLGIEERRTWATWQLVLAAVVAAMVGMMIGYSGKRGSKNAAAGTLHLSVGSIQPRVGTTTTIGGPTAVGPATTSAAPTTSPLTSPSSLPAAATGPVTVLVPNTIGSGPSDLPVFATAGAWTIGWQFRCVQAPGGSAAFTITVVPEGGSADATPAVSQVSREAKGTSPQPASQGRQHLRVTTDPACEWAVKVTGVAG